MAFRYAVLILEDLKNLTPKGRCLMVDTLINLISVKKKSRTLRHTI